MYRLGMLIALGVLCHAAEVRTLTMREAISLALKQNPDIALAKLDERRADQAVRLARAPFIPKVVAGSGLAYSSGFPMSIEGATPSIVQASGVGEIFNRPQNYRIAAAKEALRGSSIDLAAKQDEVVFRTAEAFLDAQRSAKVAEVARGQVKGLESALEAMKARIAEGRDLPIEGKRAALNLARARFRVQALETALLASESLLATAVGFEDGPQIHAAQTEPAKPVLPATPEEAVQSAIAHSKEIRSLESKLVAKGYEVHAARAERLPKVDLVAQYALLGRFNNYEDFFRKFQRHNGQLGVSFQVPLFAGPTVEATAAQAEAEAAQLRVQIRTLRTRIMAETKRGFADIQQAETAREIAQLDLDVARDQVTMLLAQMQEGRAGLRQVEEARIAETDRWISFYDANTTLEKARLNLLRVTGMLAQLE